LFHPPITASRAPCSWVPPACAFPLMWEIKFYTYTQQLAKLQFCIILPCEIKTEDYKSCFTTGAREFSVFSSVQRGFGAHLPCDLPTELKSGAWNWPFTSF
jgi:hypothetical protein